MPVLHNRRHEAFAQALAEGKSAIVAHREAGYKPDRGTASKLQHLPSIVQRVNEILSQREADTEAARKVAIECSGIDTAWVLTQLAFIAGADLGDYCDWNEKGRVTYVPKAKLSAGQRAALQEITQFESLDAKGRLRRRVRIRLHDKISALDKIARQLGMYASKDSFTAAQVDEVLRGVLTLLERHLGQDRLDDALVELRELGQGIFGQPWKANGTTH